MTEVGWDGYEDSSLISNTTANASTNLVILIVALVFIVVGITVNLLSLYALKSKRRSLMLPWLVFHAVLTTGK